MYVKHCFQLQLMDWHTKKIYIVVHVLWKEAEWQWDSCRLKLLLCFILDSLSGRNKFQWYPCEYNPLNTSKPSCRVTQYPNLLASFHRTHFLRNINCTNTKGSNYCSTILSKSTLPSSLLPAIGVCMLTRKQSHRKK